MILVIEIVEKYRNEFPSDYSYAFGKDRPFAPSLATATNGAFDPRSLAGSETCGASRCHTEIYTEWKTSAHRYAAMDPIFQGIQNVMAKQNGPESTRYCGGCHDPISLFSGTKNIFVEKLTGAQGYNEGISCLACHSIQKTEVRAGEHAPGPYSIASLTPCSRASSAIFRPASCSFRIPTICSSLKRPLFMATALLRRYRRDVRSPILAG